MSISVEDPGLSLTMVYLTLYSVIKRKWRNPVVFSTKPQHLVPKPGTLGTFRRSVIVYLVWK
jgi:hypothetical protein